MAATSLELVIDSLLSKSKTSTKRLALLADYVKLLLDKSGLPGAQGGSTRELTVPGIARRKNWDVAYEYAGKFRLLISLKSLLKKPGGSIPNRIDDLQGELANTQQLSPEIVIGHIILFDVARDQLQQGKSTSWSQAYEYAVNAISIRRAPLWNQGLLEGSWFIRFDSRRPVGQRLVSPRDVARHRKRFITSLLYELRRREPAIPFTKAIAPPPGVVI